MDFHLVALTSTSSVSGDADDQFKGEDFAQSWPGRPQDECPMGYLLTYYSADGEVPLSDSDSGLGDPYPPFQATALSRRVLHSILATGTTAFVELWPAHVSGAVAAAGAALEDGSVRPNGLNRANRCVAKLCRAQPTGLQPHN